MVELCCALWLNLNGLSHHPGMEDMQERNPGAGLAVENVDTPGRRGSLSLDAYEDSHGRMAGQLFQSYAWRYRSLAVGVGGGLMYKPTYSGSEAPVFPAVLPYLSFGDDQVRTRLTYAPPNAKNNGVVAAQIQLRLSD